MQHLAKCPLICSDLILFSLFSKQQFDLACCYAVCLGIFIVGFAFSNARVALNIKILSLSCWGDFCICYLVKQCKRPFRITGDGLLMDTVLFYACMEDNTNTDILVWMEVSSNWNGSIMRRLPVYGDHSNPFDPFKPNGLAYPYQ